jgi:hypothetical protein
LLETIARFYVINWRNSLIPNTKSACPHFLFPNHQMVCLLGRSWLPNLVTESWNAFCSPELTLEPVSTTHHASGRTRSRFDAEGFFQYLLGSAVAT